MTVFEGNTVDAAIAAGLKQMQRTREQVTVKVVAEPKRGFLGIGKQPAKVQLTAVPASAAATSTAASAAPKTQPVAASQPAKPAAKDAKAAPHSVESAPKPVVKVVQPAVQVKPAPKVNKPAKVVHAAKVQTETKEKQPAPAEPAAKRTPEEIAARQAANEQAVRDLSAYLLEVVKQLGITADLDVDFGNRYATLNFDTTKQGLLIGKHGRTINALQDLAQVYMNHHGASHVNVVLDVDDYRDRRAATLKRLAESTAREAIATGKQVFLDPMPSFERKLIHAELANNHHVTTFSEGRDPHRAVVVAIRK